MRREDLGDYDAVNRAWSGVIAPKLSQLEAERAIKRLYRRWMKEPYPRGGIYHTKHPRTWQQLVHGLSHYFHRRLHPDADDHEYTHAVIESEMIEYVRQSGWLNGSLRPRPKPVIDFVEVRERRARQQLERWVRKQRMANRKVREYQRRVRYYEKRVARPQP